MATPFSIPNKEVKRCSADDTLMKGKVGNRQLGVFDFLYKLDKFFVCDIL